MKLMKKTMFALVALLGATGYVFGYDFGVSNKTKDPMIVRLKVKGGGYQYDVIKPNKRVLFQFLGGDIALCLESISWAKYDPTDKYMGNNQYRGKNLMEIKETGVNFLTAGPAHDAFHAIAEEYALTSAPIKMLPGKVYEATAKASTALVSGIDDLACKITELAMAAQTGGATDVVKQVSQLASKDKTEATGAKKEAASAVAAAKTDPAKKPEADKAIANAQTKDKIVSLGALEVAVGSVVIDDKLFEYITTSVPAAISAFDAQKALFDDATYSKIKGLLTSGKNEDALTALEGYRKALEASTTKTSIDDDAMVYGCNSCGVNTYVDAAATKKSCSFGIGEIAGSIAELVGSSICKNREFILVPGKQGGKDEVIAITRKGE